ncbi:MAG: hypothetical protein Tsb0019_19600 [Roseibium sp.]
MSGFSEEWLALREPLDLAARNAEVEAVFVGSLPTGPLSLLDLASGAGSTVAALSPKLGGEAAWRLSDHDPALLEAAARRWHGEVTVLQVDLARDLESLPFDDVDGITTSAFLDLVSDAFLRRLVECVVKAGKPFLASLSYDGRTSFAPAHPFDGTLLAALNAHQRTDKGFGPSLGPEAAARAQELFAARGYRVVQGLSDWNVPHVNRAFLQEFLSGWVRVGRELDLPAAELEDWWRERTDRIASGELAVTVGHVDFAALP